MLGAQDSAASEEQAPDASGEPSSEALQDLDAAYYRWLTRSAAIAAPGDTKALLLEQMRGLARNPGVAAELVPRVPELIPRLLRGLRSDEVSAAELSRQVAEDVVLVAEVLREANSAYYNPITPVKTLEAAIMMLGQNGMRILLARIAFRPVISMQAEGFARQVAPHLWNQSEKCALAASLLAPGQSNGVFEAYLAGLMQNVGRIVAFRLTDRHCPDGKVPGSREFGLQLLALSRQLSAVIARHWEFPDKVVEAIARAGEPDGTGLGQALARGDHLAKLRLLIDAGVLGKDDALVAGLDNFERRCLGKLETVGA
ncbi:HDOD domain-containing protein [Massilia niastensis]|uniref:HDOD domain-containing protein n=1 Tax=Massilia niastensis TaxID=544911 RepID=UPI001E36149A|nr:HDOD domain-containing protein [Massilia niastensis]